MKITIEGNLASGKSTLVMRLQEWSRIPTFLEPVDKWTLLCKFYEDPKRWSFTFNTEVLISMSKWKNNDYQSIYERSPLSCRHVFTQLHVDSGVLNHEEITIFEKIYKEFSWKQDVIIYIKTDPHVCYERMKKRNRTCENEVSLEYLIDVDKKHATMIAFAKSIDIKVYEVDGNETAEIVFNKVSSIISSLNSD